MTHVRRATLAALALTAWARPAEAFGLYCTHPEAPYCLDQYGTFDDEWAFGRCKMEMETYLSEVNAYTQCLAQEASEVRREANDAVDRFNCKANGGTYCP